MSGGTGHDVIGHADADVLADAVAARLLVRLVDAQAARGEASVVLTGGRIAARIYRAVVESPARHAVDWSRVTLWWGDERFLPAGDPDRNETQAMAALKELPLDPARVHPMPATDGPDGDDPAAAAESYARLLASAVGTPGAVPPLDLVLLGVGEDGHVASLFPGQPANQETRPVCAVTDSPKPPPVRITLTPPTLDSATEVWLIAAGAGKADAVGRALRGDTHLPAARVRGAARTLWLLDRAAANQGQQ